MKKTTTALIILGLLLVSASALLVKDTYARNQVKSRVVVYAAGYASDNKEYPTMELSLNNSTVCQWKNIKNNIIDKTYTGKYECEIYRQKVTKDTDVRILYINASLNPNIIRKLVVDKIEVDGVFYETESPYTYTYKTRPLQPWCVNQDGYKRTEQTICNGYFQYNLQKS